VAGRSVGHEGRITRSAFIDRVGAGDVHDAWTFGSPDAAPVLGPDDRVPAGGEVLPADLAEDEEGAARWNIVMPSKA
jgi:hypothetical protein